MNDVYTYVRAREFYYYDELTRFVNNNKAIIKSIVVKNNCFVLFYSFPEDCKQYRKGDLS